MKRFLVASVIAMTVTATATTVFADEPAAHAAPAAPAAPATPAAVVAPAPAPAVPAAAASGATPLTVRPAPAPKPLALAPQSEGLGVGYKLLAILGIGGAVALYLKKKRGPRAEGPAPTKIDILARAGVGVRSQVFVVEVEGTRLLVGMTPSSIQTLAVLQTPEDDHFVTAPADERDERVQRDERAEARRASPVSTPAPALGPARSALEMVRTPNLGERVRSLLGSEEAVMPRISPLKPTPAAPRAVRSSGSSSKARATATRPKTEAREAREVAGQARGLLLSSDEDT